MGNFKQEHMDKWMELLYGPFPEYFEVSKARIIKTAYALAEEEYTDTAIAYFKGVAYSSISAPFGTNPPRLDLIEGPYKFMEELFQEKIDMENEKTIVKGYLSRILNLSVCVRDIDALLPDSIRDHMNSWRHKDAYALFPLSCEEIKVEKRIEFIKRNKQFSDMVSERILTNLLLQHGG